MSNSISIKAISELLGMNFFIPSYQRGYRWDKQQVEELLDDIYAFATKKDKTEEEFYCLQPVIVKKKEKEEWYEVIDGQQRLTTIFLIIHYINEIQKEKQEIEEITLRFETRDKSQEFLNGILVNENSNEVIINDDNIDNIDFFFISNAYNTIHNWNKSNNKLVSEDFVSKFICSSKVIWYEVSKDEDSIDIFTRINSGKIPLTNAELIKALFLNSSNFPDSNSESLRLKELEIASEWDRIEYTLQDDSFWYF
ncbi:MAG TPA: DUF262 domain-containing protein, partial [Bacteroidales bacterium]|nr:DUF262 domain-containing protein [Bacteroidales bacterium]